MSTRAPTRSTSRRRPTPSRGRSCGWPIGRPSAQRRLFGMSRAALRADRGRHRDRLLGDRHGDGAASATTAGPTTPRPPRPATSSGTARKGADSLRNRPGEFIFDVQTHHVDPDRIWRVTNPPSMRSSPRCGRRLLRHGGQIGIRPTARSGRRSRRDRPDREPLALPLPQGALPRLGHELHRARVVPTSPDTNNPLPLAEAAMTVDLVNDLARSRRCVMHAFVMPNRGATRPSGPAGRRPSPVTSTRSSS